ncbi:Acetamidase [Arthrobotrys entomopaga]|nr:Acetamidase [Arthrobotrys entomopaga]
MFSYLQHRRNCKAKQTERANRIAALPSIYTTPLTAQDRSILSTPIGTLAANIQKKEWNPVDVLRAYGKKSILAHEKTNCLTEVMIDDAEKYAASREFTGPLAGVPISMKDTVAVKGYDYCIGYSSLVNHPATRDSPLTTLLKDAGGIPYVKTNVPITLLSFESTNDVFGRTGNPHNVAYSPGGSTGGESALLAYGGSRIGMGTDVAGSVRVPAHFAGVYTVRAATGRFMKSYNNTSMAGQEGVLAVYSPMAREYDDLEYFWRSYLAMKPWTYDHHTHPIPWREDEFEAGKTGKLRYGVMRDDGVVTPSPACARALDSVVTALKEAGEDVVELDLKEMPSPYEALKLAAILLNNDGGKTYESFFTSWFEYNDAGVAQMSMWFKMPWLFKKFYVWWVRYVRGDEMWAGLLDTHWREQTTPEQWKLVGRREYYRGAWHEYLNKNKIDILLSVPNATPAVPKDGMKTAVSSCGYTFMFNLLDYTAGVLPVTKVDPVKDQLPASFDMKKLNGIARGAYVHYDATKMAGLPVGVQIVGRRLEEEKVLGVMSRVEDLLEKKGQKYELLEVD